MHSDADSGYSCKTSNFFQFLATRSTVEPNIETVQTNFAVRRLQLAKRISQILRAVSTCAQARGGARGSSACLVSEGNYEKSRGMALLQLQVALVEIAPEVLCPAQMNEWQLQSRGPIPEEITNRQLTGKKSQDRFKERAE